MYIYHSLGFAIVHDVRYKFGNCFVDSSGPQVTFDPNQPTVTLRFPRFSWRSSEFARFECSLDGFVRDKQPCGSGTTGIWQIYKPDGNYTLSVRGRDTSDNTGPAVSHSFRVGKLSCFVIVDFTCFLSCLVANFTLNDLLVVAEMAEFKVSHTIGTTCHC